MGGLSLIPPRMIRLDHFSLSLSLLSPSQHLLFPQKRGGYLRLFDSMAAWLADQIGLMRQTETWPPSSPPAGINEPSKQDGKGEMGMGGLIFTPTPVWVFQPGAPNAKSPRFCVSCSEQVRERNNTIERQFSNAGTNFLTRDNLISLAERVMMMIFGRQFDFIG